MINKIRLSPWTVYEGYCAMRFVEGTNPDNVANRVAFIEKTPRVRIAPMDTSNILSDCRNWRSGPKGQGGSGDAAQEQMYGFYQPSRDWCDEQLVAMGYVLPVDEAKSKTTPVIPWTGDSAIGWTAVVGPRQGPKLILMAVRDLVDGLRCGPWIASIWHHGGPAFTTGPFADDDQAKVRCGELLSEFIAGERRLVESIEQLLG